MKMLVCHCIMFRSFSVLREKQVSVICNIFTFYVKYFVFCASAVRSFFGIRFRNIDSI